MSKTDPVSNKRQGYCRTPPEAAVTSAAPPWRGRPGGFKLKKLVRSLLGTPDFEQGLKRTDIAPQRMINPLLCFLFDTDETIRWRAVRAAGITVSAIAETDLEAARVIMRRLMWSLNDESGGIGWGAPEAMGEIMAENEALAREYRRILVSYIDENGNLLENDELERGVMWGIYRLAQKRPHLLRELTGLVLAQLESPDPVRRGLALLTLLSVAKVIPVSADPKAMSLLLKDQSVMRVFQDGSFTEHKISSLATELFDLRYFSLSVHST